MAGAVLLTAIWVADSLAVAPSPGHLPERRAEEGTGLSLLPKTTPGSGPAQMPAEGSPPLGVNACFTKIHRIFLVKKRILRTLIVVRVNVVPAWIHFDLA
jgi:hypothetical protein